ncbi:MAG: hypothetical protein Q8Q88_09280 [Phenylobacterium sp.]|uniref:hypothetical protein n=1 Tax=Phenylobacterium sp. TaxID=1871053 RepID=UPI0027333582|nr:hypothetical protein [Phenylobacterium sp.]MDP3747225.1 hypothetical protein [Phenylobacterium sp.]
MPSVILWSARLALVALLAFALHGALDPRHNAQAFPLGPDEIEHVVLAYGLTILFALSFPKISPFAFAAAILAAGVGLEVSQALKWISGGYEFRDALANAAGAAAAVLPLMLGRKRR